VIAATVSRHRPIGLICLVVIAVLWSVILAFYSVGAFFQIVSLLKHDPSKPEYYSLGYVLLALAGGCLVVATWIAATTAVDLWKFKKRGRLLAMTAALILGIFTLLLIFSRALQGLELWIAISIFVLSASAIYYLRLPTIRSQLIRNLRRREIPEFISCVEDSARVHSQLPVRFTDETGYFRRWSKKVR